MFKKIAFTAYPVLDMQRARAFYESTLGLPPGSTLADGAWVEYDLPGGGCFALTTLMGDVQPSTAAGGSVAFEVEDVFGLSARLETEGVEFKMQPTKFPSCSMAVVVDSEGNALTLHEIKSA